MKKIIFLVLVICSFVLGSCEDNSQSPVDNSSGNVSRNYKKGFFVVNEGNFGWGKATLSFIYADGKVENNIYEKIHQEVLGNVAQSMNIFNGRGYIVVNNSQKVEVVNPTTLEKIATITGLHSPRYFLGINDKKAYITTIYKNVIYIIDLETNQIKNEISTSAWTERMIKLGKYVWVTSHDSTEVWIIDSETDQIIHTIRVPSGSKWLVADTQHQRVWILAAGNAAEAAQLIVIPLSDIRSNERRIFPTAAKPAFLTSDTHYLYWIIDNDLYQLPITDLTTALTQTPFIENLGTNNTLIYNAVISPQTGNLLLADALDYLQEGIIFEYNLTTKTQLKQYKVGVIPNDFCFVGE